MGRERTPQTANSVLGSLRMPWNSSWVFRTYDQDLLRTGVCVSNRMPERSECWQIGQKNPPWFLTWRNTRTIETSLSLVRAELQTWLNYFPSEWYFWDPMRPNRGLVWFDVSSLFWKICRRSSEASHSRDGWKKQWWQHVAEVKLHTANEDQKWAMVD